MIVHPFSLALGMTDDIDRWLGEIGLAKYANLFAANEIDLATLRHLSDDGRKHDARALLAPI